MPQRYKYLLPLIDEVKPATIIEIGVHRARRGFMMCERALLHRKTVDYLGYDMFETLAVEQQDHALNGKGQALEVEARARLERLPKGARWSLIVGNSAETLKGKSLQCDFAFIDGDHRVEVIASDFEAVRRTAKIVVFDDYFRPCPKGLLPDLARFGANKIVDALPQKMVEIIPEGDPCHATGISHLAVVRLK